MFGSVTIQGPSLSTLAILWAFYIVMAIAVAGLVVSILTKIFGGRS